jgi:hypothetical protein
VNDDVNTLCVYVFIIIADDELRDCTKKTMSIPYSLRMIHVELSLMF